MLKRAMTTLTALALFAMPGWSDDPVKPPVRGAAMGIVYDAAARSLREIQGVAGASLAGDPIPAGVELQAAVVAATQGHALGTAGEERGAVLLRKGAEGWSAEKLEGVAPSPERIALSPRGSAGALVYGEGKVAVLGGLPEQPRLLWECELAVVPAALAVSDDGAALLFAEAGEAGGRVSVAEEGKPFQVLLDAAGVNALAFLHGSRDAVAAAGKESRVYLLSDTTGTGGSRVVGEERDGVVEPSAVAVSGDNRRIVAAVRDGVWYLDLAEGVSGVAGGGARASGFSRLEGNAVFQLSGEEDGPVWIFDGDSLEPRVVFAAKAPREAAEKEQPETAAKASGNGR